MPVRGRREPINGNPEEFGQPINVRELIGLMDFSQEGLADALLVQPGLFLKAARYRIEKLRILQQAEAALDDIELDTAMRVRNAERPDGKITEKYIEQETERDSRVKEARHRRDEAKALEEWAKLLLDAFRERGSMAKALVQLIGAEAAIDSGFIRGELERMGLNRLKDSVAKRYPHPNSKREE